MKYECSKCSISKYMYCSVGCSNTPVGRKPEIPLDSKEYKRFEEIKERMEGVNYDRV